MRFLAVPLSATFARRSKNPPPKSPFPFINNRLAHPSQLAVSYSSVSHSTLNSLQKFDFNYGVKMGVKSAETRSLLGELTSFNKGAFFGLGHPLLDRIVESFLKSAGVGAAQAVSREAYFTGAKGGGFSSEFGGKKKNHGFPEFKGETNKKSVEALVRNIGKESLQWGFAGGMYSGLTHGLKEARGVHDWKNSALAGAITGAAVALTSKDHSHEQLVQCAITGAAICTAANLLSGVF